MSKTIIVTSTKGGEGKTVTATMIIPALFIGKGRSINIYEIDDNNESDFSNSKIKFKSLRVEQSKESITDVSFDSMDDSNDAVNIIDAGGGNDTLQVLDVVGKRKIVDATYIVPLNQNSKNVKNAIQTIKKIKEIEEDPKIFLLLNRCKSLDEEAIKKQFFGLFGWEEREVKGEIDNPALKDVQILFAEETRIFEILEDQHHLTLFDIYDEAKNIVNNRDELRLEWMKESKKAGDRNSYHKKENFGDFDEEIVELVKSLSSLSVIKE